MLRPPPANEGNLQTEMLWYLHTASYIGAHTYICDMKRSGHRVGSLYAGVGGICLGFKQAGYKLVWANEIDKHACTTYRYNFTHTLIEQDVWTLDPSQVDPIDVLTAGFPCQPFSVAGYRKGFSDERGNHFFRIMDFVDELKPAAVFLENVKNLESHNHGHTFSVIRRSLESEGYSVHSKVLNSKDYGNVPHNRERIYIIAFRKDDDLGVDFAFPDLLPLSTNIDEIIKQNETDESYFYRDDKYMYDELRKSITRTDTVYQWRRQYVRENKSGVCPTLTANMGMGGHNVPLVKTSNGIRKLTPEECFAFQGFPVFSGEYKLPAMARAHLYKQAGNSVSVPVITRLAQAVKRVLVKRSKSHQ
jgi:DNA (cytosine-5)-methyltransferase 1